MFWGGLGQIASAAQVFFGLIVIMAAHKYLIHTGRTTGQVLRHPIFLDCFYMCIMHFSVPFTGSTLISECILPCRVCYKMFSFVAVLEAKYAGRVCCIFLFCT